MSIWTPNVINRVNVTQLISTIPNAFSTGGKYHLYQGHCEEGKIVFIVPVTEIPISEICTNCLDLANLSAIAAPREGAGEQDSGTKSTPEEANDDFEINDEMLDEISDIPLLTPQEEEEAEAQLKADLADGDESWMKSARPSVIQDYLERKSHGR
jgi:hypothetical protein